MERTLVIDVSKKINADVRVSGYVATRRDHGKIVFLDLSDRTGLLQVVGQSEVMGSVRPTDVVSIVGKIVERPEKLINETIESGRVELQAEEIEILSKSKELPFDMGVKELDLQLPTLLDNRSLTLRHPKVRQIFELQSVLLDAFVEMAKKYDCVQIVVPTISASSTEGGAEVFTFDYFGHKAFLTQSPQLYKQMLVPVFERVFTIAHAYRSEPSVTTRHITEATQMDCEIGYVDFNELLDITEGMAVGMFGIVNERCGDVLENFGVDKILVNKPVRLTLREAQEIIFKETGRDNRSEKDLEPQDEIDISKWARENHQTDFVTITHFPTAKRAFYSMPDPSNPEFCFSMDVLYRGLEVLSGSQRVNDYDLLVDAIKSRGMDPKDFEMYLQAFKYGMPPEGGFSFGLERLTKQTLNLSNIREAALYPRDMERVDLRLNED